MKKPVWIFVSVLALTVILIFVGYRFVHTEYPEPMIVNASEKSFLDVKLNSLSLPDRLLQIEANYSLDPDLAQPTEDWELRVWIGEPAEETTTQNGTQSSQQDEASATVTITVSARVGTPLTKIGQPSGVISGIMTGEPGRFPFDRYSASIGTQNDINDEIQTQLPFRFNTRNYVGGYDLCIVSGGSNREIVTLERNLVSRWVIPFVPLLMLLLYASWVLHVAFFRRESKEIALVSNVALFLSLLSLRAIVVPSGIPFGCVFDLALVVPAAIILICIVHIIQVQIR
jgi:hypothetical protein